jgi:beta-phosphoglucomutase
MLAVIFDMDGVLVDTEPVICEAAILGLKEYGVTAVPDDFKPFVGAGEDRFIGGVAEKYGLAYKPEMKRRVYEIYLEIVKDRIKVFDGVHGLLKLLKEKEIPMALASSADRIKVDANLKSAQIPMELFKVIISGENVEHKKPAPDIFLKAAQAMGKNPISCVVIEDAVNGIAAAKAAGMKCIAVVSSFSREQLLGANPDYICSDIPDVQRKLIVSVKETLT